MAQSAGQGAGQKGGKSGYTAPKNMQRATGQSSSVTQQRSNVQGPNTGALDSLMGAPQQAPAQFSPRVQQQATPVGGVSSSFNMGTVPALTSMLAAVMNQVPTTGGVVAPPGLNVGASYGQTGPVSAPMAGVGKGLWAEPGVGVGQGISGQTGAGYSVNMPNAQTPTFLDNIKTIVNKPSNLAIDSSIIGKTLMDMLKARLSNTNLSKYASKNAPLNKDQNQQLNDLMGQRMGQTYRTEY